jgi:excisionase family DNA binding protein
VVEWRGEQLYSVREAAAILGMDPTYAHTLIRQGKLGARVLGSGRRAVSSADLDAYLTGTPAAGGPKARTPAQRQRDRERASRELDRLLGGRR